MRRLAFVVLVLVGCKHRAPTVKLEAIEVRLRVVGPPTLPVPSDAELQRLAADVVNAVPGPMRYEATATPATKLVVALEVGWEPGALRSEARAQLAAAAEDAGVMAIDRQAALEKEHMDKMPTLDEVRDHLRRTLVLTAASAIAVEDLWLGPEAKVRDALRNEDLRMDAIGFAAERRDHDAVPILIDLLKDKDADLRDRSIGALADIGDRRAVHPLAELAKFGEWEELPKIIDAVGRIGGDEASSYLDFVASSHPSPIIKEMAKRALEHMKKS